MTIEHRIDNMATRDDIAAVKILLVEAEARLQVKIADAKNSIIMWMVTVVFAAQLAPALVKLLIPG